MHHLYRHFDSDGRLLYVGISMSTLIRLRQHKMVSHWFESIVRVEIEYHESREAAMNAEQRAVVDENPLHNIALRQIAAKVAGEAKEVIATRIAPEIKRKIDLEAARLDSDPAWVLRKIVEAWAGLPPPKQKAAIARA
jgi:hypothetical protein